MLKENYLEKYNKNNLYLISHEVDYTEQTAEMEEYYKDKTFVLRPNIRKGSMTKDFPFIVPTYFGEFGDLSKDNPRLGLHEFKKKFGGDYIEFMGEFDYVLKPIYYFAFTKLVPLYRNYIKKRKKKELKDEVRNINN